ncbi:immunity 49 family protein [Streptomyces sp. NBC_00536]|uniref:immunity 49 family protein n=1 Tax=Streptomyces sp. NBC_00536 TaxID=2975769 RepID=UPI002E8005FA|nr:Imm49 family immunity protein [Streptomyces sp. NBC_00536]WUC82721.1 immunity 49 family protein [Streptomyces sp. NBC_00536]
MHIERHAVGEAALSAAVTDFAERMAGDVHRMQHDESPEYGWEMVCESFLDYLGARSVANPSLTGRDCKLAFESAAAAATGSFALTARPSRVGDVFIEYTGTGVVYDKDGRGREVPAYDWLDAFFLAFVAGDTDRDGQLFVETAVTRRGHEDRADVALVHALLAFVYGEIEDPGTAGEPGPVSDEQRSARIDALVRELGPGTDRPHHRAALATLRALAAGDRDAFGEALAAQLAEYRERHAGAGNPAPRTLLPMDALALAAMAQRWNGWQPGVDSDYLPAGPIGGFAPPVPRVRAFGADKRADAVAALAAGPLVVDRPRPPERAGAGDPAEYEEYLTRSAAEFGDPGQEPVNLMRRLTRVMDHQYQLCQRRLAVDTDGPDERGRAALLLGAEAGSAAFVLAGAEPGTEREVTVGGVTRVLPAGGRRDRVGPVQWLRAAALAVVTGEERLLAECVRVGPDPLAYGGYALAAREYATALHEHLRGADAEPALRRAATEAFRARDLNQLAPPVVLLSQLTAGDEEGFALALADALEAHRDHYEVGENASDPDAALNLDVLALVCLARRAGWEVPVRSPYLPSQLVAGLVG